MLKIEESRSASESQRIYHNVTRSDVTIAMSIDYDTPVELLVRSAAAVKYLKVELSLEPMLASRAIYGVIQSRTAPALNIAGNAMDVLQKAGWSQERVNKHVLAVLSRVHGYVAIKSVRSGGQPGVELAAAAAGVALGIDVVVSMSKGYKQRRADGTDRDNSNSGVTHDIKTMAAALKAGMASKPGA